MRPRRGRRAARRRPHVPLRRRRHAICSTHLVDRSAFARTPRSTAPSGRPGPARFPCSSKPCLELRARPLDLGLAEVLDRLGKHRSSDVHRFDGAIAVGGAAHRDDAGVGIRLGSRRSPNKQGRGLREAPGTAATTCRRRAPGRRSRAQAAAGRDAAKPGRPRHQCACSNSRRSLRDAAGKLGAADRNARPVLHVAKQPLGKLENLCRIDLPARRQDEPRRDDLVAKPVAAIFGRDRAQTSPSRPSTERPSGWPRMRLRTDDRGRGRRANRSPRQAPTGSPSSRARDAPRPCAARGGNRR